MGSCDGVTFICPNYISTCTVKCDPNRNTYTNNACRNMKIYTVSTTSTVSCYQGSDNNYKCSNIQVYVGENVYRQILSLILPFVKRFGPLYVYINIMQNLHKHVIFF